MNCENILPEVKELSILSPEMVGRAVGSYREWLEKELRKYQLSPESVYDIARRLDEVQRMPFPTRCLFFLNNRQFFRSARSWFELRPNCYPPIPSVMEALGDLAFLEAEAEGFLSGTLDAVKDEKKLDPQTVPMFYLARKAYGAADTVTMDLVMAFKHEELMRDGDAFARWRGFTIIHNQLLSKTIRALIRACSHRVLGWVSAQISSTARAIAPIEEVYLWQEKLSDRGLTAEDRDAIANDLKNAGLTLQTNFADADTAAIFLINTATLASLAGCWKRAREYARVVLELNTVSRTRTGQEEAQRLIEVGEKYDCDS